MCGISGILYSEPVPADILQGIPYGPWYSILESTPFSTEKLSIFRDLMNEIEPFVESLFDFSCFFSLYSDTRHHEDLIKCAHLLDRAQEHVNSCLLDKGITLSVELIEEINSLNVRLQDATWRLNKDILGAMEKVRDLNGAIKEEETWKYVQELWKLNFVLNNLDRQEVRGRDSAGVSCLVTFESPEALDAFCNSFSDKLARQFESRSISPDFVNLAIRKSSVGKGKRPSALAFTFKVAREIGKLGDNVATLRSAIRGDEIFLKSLALSSTNANVCAHTRWASNGIINEQNCHPVNNDTQGESPDETGTPYVITAVLNGDIDNYQDLKERFEKRTGRKISEHITTDTKIIPVVVEAYYEETGDLEEAFRLALNEFKGSIAVAMQSSLEPSRVYLALRGSGQALYVGLISRGFTFASELYGVVEGSPHFVKLDGEKERVSGDPSTSGQIFVLNAARGGKAHLIEASYFDGVSLPLDEHDVRHAQITTRDINRAGYSHFLLKEISESPLSVEKTLRGKFELIYDAHGISAHFNLGNEIIPEIVISKLKSGAIRKIYIIGQGTASVAGDGIAYYMARALSSCPVQVQSTKSTELSGFLLEDDMSSVLAIAVSQSGTTTDTNRTVDLLKSRGAHVLAIVNRRNSDLVYKSDSVFYTSDGRDIEMSVASTKAFYSQIVSGALISLYFAHVLSTLPGRTIVRELEELQSLPDKMRTILAKKENVKAAAEQCALTRKYWAVVGSGPHRVAGNEIRIKLSELCYKSIASDTIEDKKHIDLSSEPLIIVCVAGITGPNLQDLVKEVAIFKAHKACPIVIVTEGQEELFRPYASAIFPAPFSSEIGSVLLNTVYGHLFGYYAARAIEESGEILRNIRAMVVEALGKFSHATRLTLLQERATVKTLSEGIFNLTRKFCDNLRKGLYNSCLEASTSSQLNLIFKYLQRRIPLDNFEFDFDVPGTFSNVLNETIKYLSMGIDDLTRPIDAIKHQAKTVTVGISRLESVPCGILFDRLKEENISLSSVSYQNIYALQSITMAVEEINGSVLYEIDGFDFLGDPLEDSRILALEKRGIAGTFASRAQRYTLLTGRKRSVVERKRVFAGTGNNDGRPIIIVPLIEKGICRKLLLLHVTYNEALPVEHRLELLRVLEKFDDIRYTITELNIQWEDCLIEAIPVKELVSKSADQIAEAIAESRKEASVGR
jgi:glutamine---fructose-6-phosphate transaminase (isomerizing)